MSKCLIRIPLESWVVKFYQYKNRHRLQEDGVTIEQTAKDMLGKILTSYMKKTIFDNWYMGIPTESHLRVMIPGGYNRNGLTKGDLKAIGDILKDFAQDELCFMMMVYASNPGVSREKVIRKLWAQIGLTDEDYDMEHFRRYFDRYAHNSTGADFLDFRSEVTGVLKSIYDESFLSYAL